MSGKGRLCVLGTDKENAHEKELRERDEVIRKQEEALSQKEKELLQKIKLYHKRTPNSLPPSSVLPNWKRHQGTEN